MIWWTVKEYIASFHVQDLNRQELVHMTTVKFQESRHLDHFLLYINDRGFCIGGFWIVFCSYFMVCQMHWMVWSHVLTWYIYGQDPIMPYHILILTHTCKSLWFYYCAECFYSFDFHRPVYIHNFESIPSAAN